MGRMIAKLRFQVSRLSSPEHYGDWHDKPVKWVAACGDARFTQKFATRRDADFWARACRRTGDFQAAMSAYLAV